MNAVRNLLLLILLVALTLTLLLAGATGVGSVLHWLIPEVELGAAILTGVVGLSISIYFVMGILAQAHAVREELDDVEMEELVAVVHRPSRGRRARR